MSDRRSCGVPHTAARRLVLAAVHGSVIAGDLLFLEAWKMNPTASLGATLRVRQIRRANPGPAAEIRAELTAMRELPASLPRRTAHAF